MYEAALLGRADLIELLLLHGMVGGNEILHRLNGRGETYPALGGIGSRVTAASTTSER